jgi:ketosteroid isomerase-like protein
MAMSQENVEIVRAAFAAWNRGDLDAWLETFHPTAEWHTSGTFPGLEMAYFGRDGVTNFWQQFRAGWEEIFLDVEEIIDRGEQVIVLFRFRAKGRDGIQVQRPQAICDTVREGRVVRAENYAGWDQALEAAGLSE